MNTTKENDKQKKLAKMYLTNFVEKTTEVIRAEVIAKEHARLRTLFINKTPARFKGLEAKGYHKGVKDCLSELQDTNEQGK